MNISRKCINCTSFPCMKEECAKDNVCKEHKFEHEIIIGELEELWSEKDVQCANTKKR